MTADLYLSVGIVLAGLFGFCFAAWLGMMMALERVVWDGTHPTYLRSGPKDPEPLYDGAKSILAAILVVVALALTWPFMLVGGAAYLGATYAKQHVPRA